MDKLIITIPDWVVILAGVWILCQTIDNVLNIYLFYLKRKFERLSRTTSCTASTGCHECDFYQHQFKSFCANCGKELG